MMKSEIDGFLSDRDLTRLQFTGSKTHQRLPEYGSLEWWCLLHGALKKKILWDFLLDPGMSDVT